MRRDNVRDIPPRSQPELSIDRAFVVPNARRFTLTGSATVTPDANLTTVASALGLTGSSTGGVTLAASGLMVGCLPCGPAAAIDHDRTTAWQTPFVAVSGQFARYLTPRPISFDHLDLTFFADGRHSKPKVLNLDVDGHRRVLQIPRIPATPRPNATASIRLAFPRVTGRDIKITIADAYKVFQRRFGNSSRVLAPVAIAEFGIPGLPAPATPPRVDSGCRADLVTIDGTPVPVRITGASSAAGTVSGLTVNPCSGPLRLGPGRHVLATARGKDVAFSIDRIVLASGAPGGAVTAAEGRVEAFTAPPTGTPNVEVVRDGRTHLRVRVSGATRPFWLVLGQSQSRGWQAHIVGAKGLGGSKLVDGYANGWLITPHAPAFEVAMDWTPQRQVWIAIWLSLAFVLLCVAIVAVTWRRRRGSTARAGDADVDVGWRVFSPLTGRARWIAVLASGALAAVAVTPWVGVLVGAATIIITSRARARAVVLVLPAALLGVSGWYIVFEQYRHRYPSVFEWPTLFPHARTAAWIAVLLLAADAVVEVLQRNRSRTETEASSVP